MRSELMTRNSTVNLWRFSVIVDCADDDSRCCSPHGTARQDALRAFALRQTPLHPLPQLRQDCGTGRSDGSAVDESARLVDATSQTRCVPIRGCRCRVPYGCSRNFLGCCAACKRRDGTMAARCNPAGLDKPSRPLGVRSRSPRRPCYRCSWSADTVPTLRAGLGGTFTAD
jgi:hypothetical protein